MRLGTIQKSVIDFLVRHGGEYTVEDNISTWIAEWKYGPHPSLNERNGVSNAIRLLIEKGLVECTHKRKKRDHYRGLRLTEYGITTLNLHVPRGTSPEPDTESPVDDVDAATVARHLLDFVLERADQIDLVDEHKAEIARLEEYVDNLEEEGRQLLNLLNDESQVNRNLLEDINQISAELESLRRDNQALLEHVRKQSVAEYSGNSAALSKLKERFLATR